MSFLEIAKNIMEGKNMMKKLGKIIFMFIMLLLVLCACDNNEEEKENKEKNANTFNDNEFVYQSNITDSFYENFSFYDKFIYEDDLDDFGTINGDSEMDNYVIKFEKTEYDDMNVYFDSDLKEEDRKSFIENCYPLLKYMKSKYEFEDIFEYYVENKFDSAISDEKIYIKYNSEFNSSEFIEETLLSIFGDTSNYGMIYNEIKEIEEALPYCEYIKPIINEDYYKKQIENNADYLDLTYPLFAEEFYSSVEIDTAKKLAVDFSSYVKSTYGDSEFYILLEDSSELDISFDKLYMKYMNEFLKQQKLDVEMSLIYTPIRYSKILGNTFQINMSSAWVDYRFEKGYVDIHEKMRHNYSDMKKYIQQVEKNSDKLRKYWDEEINEECKRLPCYFVNEFSNTAGGVTIYDDNIVLIKYAYAFLHEYTHFLYRANYAFENKSLDISFFLEGRAVMSDALLNKGCKNVLYEAFSRRGDNNDKKNIDKMFEEYLKSIDRYTINENIFDDGDIHMAYLEITSYYTFKFTDEKGDLIFNNYRFAPVFTKYIIDNYGLEKYRKVYLNSSEFEETYDGKSIADMREEVIEYLNNKYDELF